MTKFIFSYLTKKIPDISAENYIPNFEVISIFSGNLPSVFFEKISSPFNLTSNTPPLEGINSKEDILFLYMRNSISARPAAFGK
ncbi:hypothetical protein JCM14036_28640 [Desulfotomaculum defluvii]